MSKAKLREKIRRLKRQNLALIVECNAARVRAGEAAEALQDTDNAFREYMVALSQQQKPLNG